ncbi:MAG TPA: NUDIX domain-containing protein [Prolixibacteraceae bacterium]|nr:NUDIX domain-containing protein [Prolixibacteraceae bacterium]HPS13420.1 NUDIX domain-containing protein [Prolixibacteraceae bacterium]
MYKVFFNDRVVLIGSTFKKSLIQGTLFIDVSESDEVQNAWLAFRDNTEVKCLIICSDDQEKAKNLFFGLFTIIDAAGGLVRNSENQLLCIYRWGKWDLPKGKAEKGEKIEDTALREVEEECGIHQLVSTGLNSITYHIYEHPRKPGVWVLKPTFWFNMFYSGSEILVPQVKEDIVDARWFSKKELDCVMENTWDSLTPLFQSWIESE